MSQKRKICVVITARASYARVKSVLAAIQRHPDLTLQLVVCASALLERYGPVIDVIRADGFEPDAVVYMVIEGENLVTSAKSTGLGLIELATIFDTLRPDIVVTVADRYETIATAITAAYLNIPVAHIQGGEITGSIDERVRHAVTKLSDLHFVSNTTAAERVRRLGEDPASVHVTGCPSIDLLTAARIAGLGAGDLLESTRGVGTPVDGYGEFLVVLQHSVPTEYESASSQIRHTLDAIEQLRLPTVWFWPNVDAGSDQISKVIRESREKGSHTLTYFLKNLPPEMFLALLVRAKCLVGNSSVGIREASALGLPVVNIGSRQAGRDRASNVVDVAHDRDSILTATQLQWTHGPYPPSVLYGDGLAGEKIAALLASSPLTIAKRLSY